MNASYPAIRPDDWIPNKYYGDKTGTMLHLPAPKPKKLNWYENAKMESPRRIRKWNAYE